MLLETGSPDQARNQFQTVISADPHNLSAAGNIGLTYLNQGNLTKAIEQFERVLQVDAASTAVQYNLGLAYTLARVHWQDGEFDDVLRETGAAIAANPNYAEAYYLLGTALKQGGQLDDAVFGGEIGTRICLKLSAAASPFSTSIGRSKP